MADTEALNKMAEDLPPETDADGPESAQESAKDDQGATVPVQVDPMIMGTFRDIYGQMGLAAHWTWEVDALNEQEIDALALPSAKLAEYYGAQDIGPAGCMIALGIAGVGIGLGRYLQYRMIKAQRAKVVEEKQAQEEKAPRRATAKKTG